MTWSILGSSDDLSGSTCRLNCNLGDRALCFIIYAPSCARFGEKSTAAVELNDNILLRFNREEKCAIGLTLMDFGDRRAEGDSFDTEVGILVHTLPVGCRNTLTSRRMRSLNSFSATSKS